MNFVLTLVIVSVILRKVDGVLQFLQQSYVDLHTATGLLQTLMSELKYIWENTFWNILQKLPIFQENGPIFKNQRNSKNFFDEICEVQRLESTEKQFEVEIFNLTLDCGITEMERRFQSFNYVSKCLQPISLIKLNDDISPDEILSIMF